MCHELRCGRRFDGSKAFLQCPWHGWEYDLRTGQSWFDPARVLVRKYDVSVEPGQELQKGPYVAETYPVSVEQQYVVVEIAR